MIYTFDENIVSDLFKDTYGFRPREAFWSEWNAASDDRKQAIWDNLLVNLEAEMQAEKAREERAIVRFEARVAETIELGAQDRATALRWIMEADKADGDFEYLAYLNGLSYRYFKNYQVEV
jgi:predicted Fe-S protein YdhL (DUF1289 family)